MFSLYTSGGLPGNGIFQVYKWHVELGNILFLFLPAFLVAVSPSNSVITPSFSVHLGQSWLPAVNLSIARLWQFVLYNSWKLILMDTHTHTHITRSLRVHMCVMFSCLTECVRMSEDNCGYWSSSSTLLKQGLLLFTAASSDYLVLSTLDPPSPTAHFIVGTLGLCTHRSVPTCT